MRSGMKADKRPEKVILRAEFKPKWSDFRYQRADFKPEMVDFRLDKADLGPKWADLKLERANFRSKKPESVDFGPKRAKFWA